ncbi:hypothetical protein [Tepidibacter hydrothermalis]|uniref:Exodeoxyribonuclease X-like C-terminal domain-containing protein n=1 Tax=Tepidibacter hydrothermalis TaxID=3036126 RepID=A0ABY8EJ50_9FIRM|nr:hypothetical protein [Tepidibacter hydrothermalis]WFD11984.1 hypothetical protein P4S50_07875 [Tepidibacter hydrothermalis]
MNNEMQVMPSAMSIIDTVDVTGITNTIQKIGRFQAVVQQTLKSNHDYGTIPGTNKPTLLKPGAEKILMLMGLTSVYNLTEKVQDYEKGFFAYTVKCELYKDNQKITEGLGHCNTKEDKYRWKWVKEADVPKEADKDYLKSKTDRYGNLKYRVENEDPYTLANTCLKMAKKRAQIDATLTVASLSEIFTQDIEDMKDFIQNENIENMDLNEAQNIKLSFGKHKGKTLKEIYTEYPDYIEWLKLNTKDAVMKKAAEIIIQESKKDNPLA